MIQKNILFEILAELNDSRTWIDFQSQDNKLAKGQTKSKQFFQANISSKKQTNKFYFTTYETSGRLVFVRFLEEIEDTKNTFRN